MLVAEASSNVPPTKTTLANDNKALSEMVTFPIFFILYTRLSDKNAQ